MRLPRFVYFPVQSGQLRTHHFPAPVAPRPHDTHEYSQYCQIITNAPTSDSISYPPSPECSHYAQLDVARAHARAWTDPSQTITPQTHDATGPMTTIFARSPLQSLPMATNRPTTRRRSVKQAFEEDDAPAPKRPKTEVNGPTKRATGATRKAAAAKAAYEENDDGFQFSRRTSRRTTKAQAVPVPEPIPEDKIAKPTSRRKKNSIAAIDSESSDTQQRRRRSTRLSGDREQLEVRTKVPEPSTAKRKSVPVDKERKKHVTPAPEVQPKDKSTRKGLQTPTQNDLQVSKKRDPNAQRIMLPFADTPVITRNKEMRKGNKDGHRRSSTGLRGRRASSLIDSGMSNGEWCTGSLRARLVECVQHQLTLSQPYHTLKSKSAISTSISSRVYLNRGG